MNVKLLVAASAAALAVAGGAFANGDKINITSAYITPYFSFTVYGNLTGFNQSGPAAASETGFTAGQTVAAGQIDEFEVGGLINLSGTDVTQNKAVTVASYCFDLLDPVYASTSATSPYTGNPIETYSATSAGGSAITRSLTAAQVAQMFTIASDAYGWTLSAGSRNGAADFSNYYRMADNNYTDLDLAEAAAQAAIWHIEYGVSIDFTQGGTEPGGVSPTATDPNASGGCTTYASCELADYNYILTQASGISSSSSNVPNLTTAGVQDVAVSFASITIGLPEPDSWVVMLAGTFATGAFLRRRRSSKLTPAPAFAVKR